MPISGSPPLYHLHGVGDPDLDNATFAKFAAIGNARGNRMKGVITGDLQINDGHLLTFSPELVSVDGGKIGFVGADAYIAIGDSVTSTEYFAAGVAIDPTTSKQEYISLAGALDLANGDYVIVWADNEIDGPYTPAGIGVECRPLEIMRIAKPLRPSGTYSTTDFYLNGYIWDALTTNPKVTKLTPIKNPILRNLNWYQVGDTTTGQAFRFQNCVDVLIEGCTQFSPGPGQIGFYYVHGFRVVGNTWGEKIHPDDNALVSPNGYAIQMAVTRNGTIQDNRFSFCRHAVTNGGIETGGHHYGVDRNLKMIDNRCEWAPIVNSSGVFKYTAPLDQHSEGVEVEIRGNTIILPASNSSTPATFNDAPVAISCRSRSPRIIDNTVVSGDSYASAIQVFGPGAEIRRNKLIGGWTGIWLVDNGNGGNVDNAVIEDNYFQDLKGPGVKQAFGSNLRIKRNRFDNVGSVTTKCCIDIAAGTGHEIDENIAPKASNDYFLQTNSLAATAFSSIRGNKTPGYLGGLGCDTSKTATPALNLAWHRQGVTEQPTIVVFDSGHAFDSGNKWYAIGIDYNEWDPLADPFVPLLGLLLDAFDNYLVIVPVGEVVNINILDLPGDALGSSYDLAADGPHLYYNPSVHNYTKVVGGDPVLFVNDRLGNTLQGTILGSQTVGESGTCALPVVTKSANFTLAMGDNMTHMRCEKSTQLLVTVPLHSTVALSNGFFSYEQKGAGKITMVPATGAVVIRSSNGLLSTAYQYSLVTLFQLGDDEWLFAGERGI